MTEKTLFPWIAANGLMDNAYREQVVTDALNHYQHASPGLRKFVLDIFKKSVHVNGFRPFPNIPMNRLRPHVISEFEHKDAVAVAVVCLWGEKQVAIIDALKAAAQDANIAVQPTWGWEDARYGFFGFDDIPELNTLANKIAEQKSKPESDHYLLASLWLSRGLFMENVQEPVAEIDDAVNDLEQPAEINKMTEPIEKEDGNKEIDRSDLEFMESLVKEPNLDTEKLDRESIIELSRYWESQSSEIIGARDSFLAKIEELRTTALNGEPDHAIEKIKQLEAERQAWDMLKKQSDTLVDYIQARVAHEFQKRPDIKDIQPEVRDLSENPTEEELVAILPDVFQAIVRYDEKRVTLLSEVGGVRNDLLKLEQSLLVWQGDVAPIQHQLQELNDAQELPFKQLQSVIENSKKVVQDGKVRRHQARGISINRIMDTMKKFPELVKGQDIQIGKYVVSQLDEAVLQEMPGKDLQELEKESMKVLNQLVVKARIGNSQKIVAQLRQGWNEAAREQLLEQLAIEKKDLEGVLVELASNVTHSRSTRAVYSREVAKSLFSGVSELSTDTDPYLFLNQMATCFFLGWTASDPVTRSERCILALAAQAGKDPGLPPGFLWEIEGDWPDSSLENWGRLWQAVLLENEVHIYTDQKIVELRAELESKQRNIDAMLIKDGGHYMRLATIKSDRHRTMMNNHVLPLFLEQYEQLTKQRKQLESAPEEKHSKLLDELKALADKLEKTFMDKKLEEIYQKGIYEDKINDNQPFHAKISMRIIAELSTGLLEYCSAMLNLETLREERRDGLSFQNLADELMKTADMSLLIKPALEQIVKGSFKSGKVRNEEVENNRGIQTIINKLLSDSALVHRFPQTICLLVNQPFDWEMLLQSLLADIEFPLDITQAANQLLERNASDQILLVVQQIPLDIQKLAQMIHRDQEKKISDLEGEYIKLGGDSEWAKHDHDLGRWGYLTKRLTDEIEETQKKSEEEHHVFEDQSFAFRERINKLDMEIFKTRSSIPMEVNRLLQNGLAIARKASEVRLLFPLLKEYLDEIEYRLNRESWIETEVENATQELEKQLLGTRNEENLLSDAEQILKLLNAGDVSQLGLDPDELIESKITTRANVLDNWLAIKSLGTILSSNLRQVEVEKIKALFSYFARMNQMVHSRGLDGNYMSYDNPIVHEYFELRFPRTPALSKQCVLIALPGNPPSADDFQSLDLFLEKENFLAVHFVFLFVPGCNNKIAKRINQNYSKQGLVLIDEQALIRMILAERESMMVPLGKLRPLMLNSMGANADIFTVNQSVNSRTSIFFGRDQLVERITSSGSSYAIYGGRRIGKSSVIRALEQLLGVRNQRVISYSLEGEVEYSEEYISRQLASLIGIQQEYEQSKDFKNALFSFFDTHPDESLVLILDEIDRYISENRGRHTLIEAFRATSDRVGIRFRVIIAGFMELYDCLSGRGPYTPTSDPWGRMLNNMGPLENLKPSDAEKIVQEGFLSILGWNFEHRAIPRRIVERTGGHPAFVQYFCLKLQEQVAKRGDQMVMLKDIDTVFDDNTPEKSFIWFVRKTLEMNLSDPTYKRKANSSENASDPVSRYLLLWLASDSATSKTFTLDQIREIANLSKIQIPENILLRSLELLRVTSVVREKASQLYEFTVPDYPMILNRLDDGSQLEKLENELKSFLERQEA